MRRLILIALLALALLPAMAQEVRYANAVVFEWDAVATLTNGDPIPPGDTITYEVFVAAPSAKPGAIVATVNDTLSPVSFQAEGPFSLGVRSVRTTAGGEVLESEIAWLDDPADAQAGEAVVILVLFSPEKTAGLRLQ